MKKLFYVIFLVVFYSLSNVWATNDNIPVFYWHNAEGLKPAAHCKITTIPETKFRISSYFGNDTGALTENLRNYHSVQQSYLRNGSLVKITKGRFKKKFEHIEVVGINGGEAQGSKWYSKRGDSGYLFNRSLLPVEDFVIKPMTDLIYQDINLREYYFKVYGEGEYYGLHCPEFNENRTYLLFHAHHPEASGFLVAVYWDETEIFSNILTIKKDDAIKHNLIPTPITPEDLIDEEVLTEDDINSHQEEMVKEDDDQIEKEMSQKETQEETQEQNQTPATENESNETSGQIETQEQIGTENIVCISTNTLNVRNDNLDKVIFRVKKGETVKNFQDWNQTMQEAKIGGVSYKFIKVEFPDIEAQDSKIGWVVGTFIKPKSQCEFIKIQEEKKDTIEDSANIIITGLDDPNCCEFPTVKKVTHSYLSGMRRFNARRGGGKRLHAACDLYRFKDEPIVAVAPGKILRDRYFFYQGTYALEVMHPGGFIVRYGEITSRKIPGISKGKNVKMGERLGYIGVVNSGCCRPMLHFELYKGTHQGPLSQNGNKFQRRVDLINPTQYLLRWEDKKF